MAHPRAHSGPYKRLDYAWALVDHCCRSCFARVLARPGEDGKRVYRCSNCGAEAVGQDASVLCACGIRLKSGRDAGIRCEVNVEPTPEFPSQVVAAQSVPGALK